MSTSARTADATTEGRRRTSVSLRQAAGVFWRYPSPWIIAGVLLPATVARVWLGGWTTSDLLLAGAMVAVHPMTEWLTHVFLLHWRPRRILGITIDPLFARKHREHHADPRDPELVFIPTPVLVGLLVAGTAAALVAFPRPGLGLTFLATLAAIGFVYEWCHYLIHTDYRPRTAVYRAIWRNHRLHHYKNEQYWFTVTNTVGDSIMGTRPAPNEVPTSPTARDLLGTGR